MTEKTRFKKLVAKKIDELRGHFKLNGELSSVTSALLERVAMADIQLERHEILCLQVGVADAEHAYLFAQRDAADRKYRLRLGALQKLLHQSGFKKPLDHFGLESFFGYYTIQGRQFIHWKYIQCRPGSYGFSKLPKDAITVNGEHFIPVDTATRLQKRSRNGHLNEKELQRANLISRNSRYEALRPSEWRRYFSPEVIQPQQQPQFDDALPVPADAKSVKAVRNRLDYLKRKAKQS